jgi:iron complex outermembrane receptor protein
LRDFGASHELRKGDLGLRVNAQVRYDHGQPALVDSARSGVATLRGDYQLNNKDELSFWLGVSDTGRGLGFSGDPVNTNGLRTLRTENGFAHLRWRRVLGPTEELQFGYYHNEEHATEAVSVYLPPFFPVVPVDYNRTSSRDNFDFQHLFAPTAATRVAWGLELRRDAIRSARVFFGLGEQRQQLARAFGSVEWRPHATLTLNGGAMLERYDGKDAKLAPRLFANWHVVPGHTVRVGSSVAYRAPSLFEERADMRFYSNGYSGTLLQVSWLGQSAIRPERIHANELGYLGQFKTWDGVFDLRVYREKITDFIQDVSVAPPPGVVFPRSNSFVNQDLPVRFRGFEWHYKARPAPGTQVLAGHSNLTVQSAIGGGSLEREAPNHTTTLTWLQDWTGRWSTTLSAIRYSAYKWGSGSLPLPGYTSLDARLAYRFGTAAKPAEIALVLLNQGKRHEEYVLSSAAAIGNPVPRLVFLTVRFGI